jgi:hypothetical protein
MIMVDIIIIVLERFTDLENQIDSLKERNSTSPKILHQRKLNRIINYC